jgi:anti-sigma factor ChrR (cupin superfamily)
MHENLLKLQELTEALPVLTNIANLSKIGFVKYEVECGSCHGVGLFKDKSVAVQMAIATAGTKFPAHSHNEYEFIVLVSGKLISNGIEYDGPCSFYVRTGEFHEHTFLTDCVIIAVTVPASEGYPDGKTD